MLLNALSVIIGIVGTIALSETMSFSAEKVVYTNSMTALLLAAFAIGVLHYVYKRIDFSDKRGKVCSGFYSFGLAFALTAGKHLHTVENFAVGNPVLWGQILVLAIFFWGYVWFLFQWLAEKKTNNKEGSVMQSLFTWLVIFLCWIPVFLAFYPGAFVYDAQDEYVQVASRVFTTHHPLTHVLLLGGFVCFGNKFFGSYNIGIAMYTLFQMFVLSGIFAYTISYLRTKLPKGVCVAVTLFYGLFPVIPMYAVCSAKDTLFNGAFLLMLVQMLKLSETLLVKKCADVKWDVIVFIAALASMMLLRNNGMYVVLALIGIILVIILCKYKERKYLLQFVVVLAAGFLLYMGIDKALTYVLQADDSASQEILTVPIQQLTRTYKYSPEVFSEDEKEILFSYIPEDILNVYDADLSDLVKANFNNQKYAESSSEFWKLWFDTFKEKPVTYLNAWLMTSYGYWYPDTIINVYGGQQRFTFQYEESSYFGFETEQPGVRDSKFPWREEQYRRMSLEIYQQNVSVISMLFSPGFLFWMFMGSLMFCFYQKRYQWLVPLGSIFLLWGTAILGPTFLVRYVLILWFALPLWSVLYYYDCGKVFGNAKELLDKQ